MLISFDYLFKKYDIKSKFVLHCGASLGQEREEYRKQGIESVIWVEAIPDVHRQLCENIKTHSGHIALCACLSDVDGQKVKFNIASNDGQSSSFLEFGTHSHEHPTVKFVRSIELTTTRLDTLLSDSYFFEDGGFLNLDLQGAELLALKGMGNLIDFFDYAYIEVNQKELYKGCPLIGELDEFMALKGFKRVETKFTGNGWGDALYSRC